MVRTGQVSMEYMIVVGFSILMIIPIVAIYGAEKNNISDRVNERQAATIARKITDSAETVYYFGKPTKTTIKVYMPHNVKNIVIGNNYISMIVMIGGTLVEIPPSYSAVNLTGNVTPRTGIQFIEITADDYAVNISG